MLQCSLLANVDLLVPLPPDLGRGEHATGTAHVTEGSLTGTVGSTTRDTRDTGDGATCDEHKSDFGCPIFCDSISLASPAKRIFEDSTHQFPRTQQRSGDQPSRSQRMAVSCSWPYRCGPTCAVYQPHILLFFFSLHGVFVLDNVRADWGLEDIGERVAGLAGRAIGRDDGNGGPGSHFGRVCRRWSSRCSKVTAGEVGWRKRSVRFSLPETLNRIGACKSWRLC